ncbi:MAG: hypothetical protein DMG07_01535 [Acidobacteria bacterium]|nr:MAG: hypothetical protein DMG07_01535 [Acidobacteriota bacterium]
MTLSRRELLYGITGTLAAPLLLGRADAQVTPDIVRFRPEIEPLVALIERTPREKCAALAVEQLRRGVSYRQLLGALFLAGIRNINPRPPGFALHCVFVIHSAHLMSLEAPSDVRLLPLFYALDDFKLSQERDAGQASGDYTMREIRGSLPGAERAAAELQAAMEAWNSEDAERAVVALARQRSPGAVFELLWRYGARDYRNIGHKAIFVSNACRTLHAIGWQHAEPVLRSLVLGLLDFGRGQRMNGYALDDQCYAGNLARVSETFPRLRDGWSSNQPDPGLTRAVVSAIREASPDEACAEVARDFARGKATAGAVWDAVHLAAAELRMRAVGGAAFASVHAVTSANALHYAYAAASDPQVRFLLLLQAVGWMGQFRTWSAARPDNLRPLVIADLEKRVEAGAPEDALEKDLTAIFAAIPSDPTAAAARVFRLARDLPARQSFLAAALRSTAAKVNEVHYYKYLAAWIEDIPLVSPEWQPHVLASTVYYIKGAGDAEPPAMARAREALRAL